MTPEEFDRAHLWRFRATALRAIDAATVVVLADTGFGGRHEVRVRLQGIDAPESGTGAGKVATAWLDRYLNSVFQPKRWELRVETTQRETVVAETRSFERYVGRVWVAVDADGPLVDLASLLVGAGHAEMVAT